MKKLLIIFTIITCVSIAVVCCACQKSSDESTVTTAPATQSVATADETTTMPKITDSPSSATTATAPLITEPAYTVDGTVATYPNGMPIVAHQDNTTVLQ